MSEFDQENLELGQTNINAENNSKIQQDNVGKMPGYSFWAEQIYVGNNNAQESEFAKATDSNHSMIPWENDSNARSKSPKKSGKKFVKFVLKALSFGILASISFMGSQEIYYHINPSAEPIRVESEEQGKDVLNEILNIDPPSGKEQKIATTTVGTIKSTSKTVISDVVENTMPSIVSISSVSSEPYTWYGQEYNDDMESSGSGFIIGNKENELLIATNNHVVEGASQITVTFIDGTEAEAVIKGTDSIADLAVISVDTTGLSKDTLGAVKVATLNDSNEVKVGEMAIAIGNALGYGQSVTVGYISAKDRTVEVSNGITSNTMVLLQTDAAINPGNSGGALLNINGEVIGINSVKYASSEVEGMGYAIPISRALPIINELMNRVIIAEEDQGYLGIAGSDVTADVAASYQMPMGVCVAEISVGAAADKAGILKGDIITAINGVEITSIVQLREKVTSFKIGTEVEITFMRSNAGVYTEKSAKVVLEANPDLNNIQEEQK